MMSDSDVSPITILIVDDHALLRDGLCAQISVEPGMAVVDTCGDADTAISLVAKHKPNIVLMDIDLPGLSCFAACGQMAAQSEDTRVIFLSAYHHDRYIDQALEVNAWGYVTKGESISIVLEAIRSVSGGRVHFSDDVKSRIVAEGKGFRLSSPSSSPSSSSRSRVSTLSPRELEVLRYLAKGLSVKEVAKIMHISAKTVDNHKTHIMQKLDIHDRVELARFAFREGIAAV
jgi:DNA-binding NarL/FixJ family response regulator